MPGPINLMVGLPDEGQVRITQVAPAFDFIHGGTASFLLQLRHVRPWHIVWVGPAAPAVSKLAPGPIINYLADPDICGASLLAASKNAAKIDRLWFNHPDQILRSTRDKVSAALQGIPGLDAPRVVRLAPNLPGDIIEAIERHDLGYPVIVRSAGEHGGKTLVKIDSPSDQNLLVPLLSGARDVYISQFRNFAGPDGLYRRYRFAVIGGKPYIKSIITGSEWNLHAASRIWNDDIIKFEKAELDTFDDGLKPKMNKTVEEIANRLKLDYFGIDCAVKENGELVLFEANACMNMLIEIQLQPDIWKARSQEMTHALLSLFDSPGQWFCAKADYVEG